MRFLIPLGVLIFLATGCCDCPAMPEVSIPTGKQNAVRANVVVSVNGKDWFIGRKKVENQLLDSFLIIEINKLKTIKDTPTVVINADSTALYGDVFRVMRMAKSNGAKVVANAL